MAKTIESEIRIRIMKLLSDTYEDRRATEVSVSPHDVGRCESFAKTCVAISGAVKLRRFEDLVVVYEESYIAYKSEALAAMMLAKLRYDKPGNKALETVAHVKRVMAVYRGMNASRELYLRVYED